MSDAGKRSMERKGGLLLLAALCLSLSSGCAYFRNRGNDAMDFLDIGVTVNKDWSPDFGLYFDPFSILPIGYSAVDCKFYGLSHRKFGGMDYTNHCWGAVVWGSERRGIGEFDANNPYHVRADQKDAKDWQRFENGLVGVFVTDEPPPVRQDFEFNRGGHFGWVGFDLSCRISEMVDFLLGWTTLDIMGDDK